MSDRRPLEKRIREEPVMWTGELQVQPDVIISKTLFEQKTGTITVFAFDKDQALSEHTAPFDAFVYILSGHMEIRVNSRAINVREGESLIMPANVPHALTARVPTRMLLIMIRS
jgi:quercetin dioxygenase-like cupin family protein